MLSGIYLGRPAIMESLIFHSILFSSQAMECMWSSLHWYFLESYLADMLSGTLFFSFYFFSAQAVEYLQAPLQWILKHQIDLSIFAFLFKCFYWTGLQLFWCDVEASGQLRRILIITFSKENIFLFHQRHSNIDRDMYQELDEDKVETLGHLSMIIHFSEEYLFIPSKALKSGQGYLFISSKVIQDYLLDDLLY